MSIKTIIIATLAFITINSYATDTDNKELLNLGIMARFDYQREYLEGDAMKENCGFRGKTVSIYLNGNLNKHFSYAYRQRLNRAHKDENFFDATDFLYLTYMPTDKWEFAAGKQIVAIGGHEYDLAPIDCYYISEYSNNIDCYQLGVSGACIFAGGNYRVDMQFCQSPFRRIDHKEDTYAYNLLWSGSRGWFKPLYSINFVEYIQGKFLNYIALGNHFTFGKTTIFVDIMNRSFLNDFTIFKDFTIVGKASFDVGDHISMFVKVSHDYNDLKHEGDWSVMPGTSITRAGGGMEIFPLKQNRDLRIHAVCSHTFGENGNPDGALCDRQTYLNIGLSWRMNLLSWKK